MEPKLLAKGASGITLHTQVRAYCEVDKKRWFVRYLLVSSVLVVLALKVYLLLFVMDFVLGIYSFFSSFILLNILIFAYFRYRDPDEARKYIEPADHALPLFTIVVPVKNEEENIRNCVESCLKQTYRNKEIIIINDGSTDETPEILDSIRRENLHIRDFYILHLSKSVGKKKAIEAASQIAKGKIYAFMDSDCDMEPDAVEIAARIFISDKQLGALTSHGRVRGAHGGNILQKFQDVYMDSSCRANKGAESTFSSVSCCSGSLSFYKREAIQDFIHEWANDRFLGMDFKFCTDRRMTAYVLATSPTPNPFVSNPNVLEVDIPILQTGHDDIETLKATIDSDLEYPRRRMRNWNVKYSQKIRVNVGVPNTLSALIKQQIRWKKSFIRSLSSTGGVYWKRPAYIALLFYIQTAMKFIRPYIVFHALFMLPFEGDLLSTILWISGILYTGMIYAVDFRLRNPRNKLWLYRPVFTLLTTFLYTWLLPYAAITIRNRSWR